MQIILASTIFLLTLVWVIWQPRNLSIGWSALHMACFAKGSSVRMFLLVILLVAGVAGLRSVLTGLIEWTSSHGLHAATISMGFIAAVLPDVREALIYANVI